MNKTHRIPAVAGVVAAQGAQRVEVHAVRLVAIAVRGRPVVAVAAHIVDPSPIAEARSRQEDRTGLLQGVPLRG